MDVTALFAPIEKLIIEHGSAAVLRDYVAFMKTQCAVLERENARLQIAVDKMEKEHVDLKAQLQVLADLSRNSRKICPFCETPTGQLVDLSPHPTFGELGVQTGLYRCTQCHRDYTKEHEP